MKSIECVRISGMFADVNEKAGIEERYGVATATSNLRVGNDHTLVTPGDIIAAAGMNKHRMGLALLRLRSEWGSAARPQPPTPEQIAEHSRRLAVEGPTLRAAVPMTSEQIERAKTAHGLHALKAKSVSWCSVLEIPNPHAGKVRVEFPDRVEFQLPLKVARRERWRWYEHEVRLALMTMRSLPAIRDGILHHARKQEWDCDEHAVATVLLWWLDPKCPACGGRSEDVVEGTGRTNGRKCSECKGTGQAHQGEPPMGRKGAKIGNYIAGCLNAARSELREGAYRMRRTLAGESQRQRANENALHS